MAAVKLQTWFRKIMAKGVQTSPARDLSWDCSPLDTNSDATSTWTENTFEAAVTSRD